MAPSWHSPRKRGFAPSSFAADPGEGSPRPTPGMRAGGFTRLLISPCIGATPDVYMCIHPLQPSCCRADTGNEPPQSGYLWRHTATGIHPNWGQGLPPEHGQERDGSPSSLLQTQGEARPSCQGGWQWPNGALPPRRPQPMPWVGGSFPEDSELNKGNAWNNPGLPAIYSSMPVPCRAGERYFKAAARNLVCLPGFVDQKI